MSKELSEIVDGVVRRVLEEKSGVSSAQPVKQNTLSKMTLAAARELIKAVETKARDMGVNAVVAVSDAGGNPVAVECMDGAFLASYDIALNKAYTVVALKMPTSKLAELAKPRPPAPPPAEIRVSEPPRLIFPTSSPSASLSPAPQAFSQSKYCPTCADTTASASRALSSPT